MAGLPAKKPSDIASYKKWMNTVHRIRIDSRQEYRYGLVADRILITFQSSDFWKELLGKLSGFDKDYLVKSNGYRLFLTDPPTGPELVRKPYNSLLLKSFRRNVLDNKDWPNAPVRGLHTPENWYSTTNDILRTMFVVKYLDGVKYLAEQISELASAHKLDCKVDYEARESGYYAAHVYIIRDFEIPGLGSKSEIARMHVEIQITTQLQETILKLTHSYYEERRARTEPPDVKWQWDYTKSEFSANYLGHILHYVEGMIMEIRDKQGGSKP